MIDVLLREDLYNHWCWRDDVGTLGAFYGSFGLVENEYLDKRVRHKAMAAVTSLMDLDRFVARNFFRTDQPRERARLQLYPGDQLDADKYNEHVKQLNELIDLALKARAEYRRTVTRRLKV